MQENKEPIKDEEMDKYVNGTVKEDFHEKLKDLIKETEHGNRILVCSDISNSVSLESLVQAYEKNIGYDFSKGTITIDELSLERAAEPLYKMISKELGIEITSLSDKQLKDVVTLKKKSISNPKEYYTKVREMYEEGSFSEKDTNIQNNSMDSKELNSKKYIFTEMSIAKAKEISTFSKSFVATGSLSKDSIHEVIDSTLSYIEETEMSKELKHKFYNSIDNIRNKYDSREIELIRLCKEKKYAQGFAIESLDDQIKELIGNDIELNNLHRKIMQNPNEIPQEYIDKINNYENDMATVAMISSVSKILGKRIEDISEKDKKNYVALIIAGALGNQLDISQNEQIIGVLEALCPDVDFAGADGKKDIRNIMKNDEALANFKKYLPLDEDKKLNLQNIDNVLRAIRLKTIREFDPKQLDRLRVTNSINETFVAMSGLQRVGKGQILHPIRAIRNMIQNRIKDDIMDELWEEKAEEMDLNDVIEQMDKSVEEKYFDESKLKYTETDKKSMLILYQSSTMACWISEKQDYLDLKYASLLQLKAELEGKESLNKLESQRLDKINDRIKDFIETNKDYDINKIIDPESPEGKLLPEMLHKLEKFESNKIKSKLMVTFMNDSADVSDRTGYERLSEQEKKEYLRNTIVGLSYKRTNSRYDKMVSKFTERRLEIISSDNDKFIDITTWDNGYRAAVDYNRLLEEYNKYSSHKFKSFEELEEYCNANKKIYVAEKLDEYGSLRDEDFVAPEGKTLSERVKFIEGMKYLMNNREEKSRETEQKLELDNNSQDESKAKLANNSNDSKHHNIEEENAQLDQESSELPVPISEKTGFFRRIFNKLKEFFTNENDKSTDNEAQKANASEKAEENPTAADLKEEEKLTPFEASLRKGTENVNIEAAIRKTEQSLNNGKQKIDDKVSQVQGDGTEVEY